MKFDFDTLVNRKSMGNMKYIISSNTIKNKGVISYAGAEMDFKTAPAITSAMIKRCDNGLFGFTVADERYLDSIVWWMKQMRQWTVDIDHIVPTYGTIHSIATMIREFTEVGDGIIVQPPVYGRYEQAATRLDRKTVYNPLKYADGHYSMDFDNLKEIMENPKNKLMILCNPHNPVGRTWHNDELTKVALLAKKYGVLVFSDEIFAEVVFNGNKTIPYSLIPEAKENCIVATALGKTFNLTGFNNANIIIANKSIRERFIKQRNAGHFGSIDPLVHAAMCSAYSQEGINWVTEMLKYLDKNIRYITDFFKENLPDVKIIKPEGTFTLWMDWNGIGLNQESLNKFLANDAYLELDIGENYGIGGVGFARMNIACPHDEIVHSMELLKTAYNNKIKDRL